jgi:hypothetical protein
VPATSARATRELRLVCSKITFAVIDENVRLLLFRWQQKNRLSYRTRAPTVRLFLMVPLNSIVPFTDMLAQAVECPLSGVADIHDHFFNRFFSDKKIFNALFS